MPLSYDEHELDRNSSLVATRVPLSLARKIEREAAKELISVSAFVRRTMAQVIEAKEIA